MIQKDSSCSAFRPVRSNRSRSPNNTPRIDVVKKAAPVAQQVQSSGQVHANLVVLIGAGLTDVPEPQRTRGIYLFLFGPCLAHLTLCDIRRLGVIRLRL